MTESERDPCNATAMPTYSVFPIEQLISPTQLTAYKTHRLTSLQIDLHAFSSATNYAREVAFTEDVWRERLGDSHFKQTFIASVLDDAASLSLHECDNDNGDEPDVGETGEWIGMATVVAPSGMDPSFLTPFREAEVGANWAIYALFSMWVHPAHRGKGIGTQLVNACLEWARINVDTKFSSLENGGDFEKVVVLLAYIDNVAGRALYSRTGFTEFEGVDVGQSIGRYTTSDKTGMEGYTKPFAYIQYR